MLKRLSIICLFLLAALTVSAQKDNIARRAYKYIKHFLDSSVIKTVDSNYIVVPKRPWQLIARYNNDQMVLKMHTVYEDSEGYVDMSPRLNTGRASSMGLWFGYRGYGLGYSIGLSKRTGDYFTFGAVGGNFGVNLRLRTFSVGESETDIFYREGDDVVMNGRYDLELPEAIRVRALSIDGYYMFNNKRFSYASAYDMSTIQVRSAGSLMVGLMWNAVSVRFNTNRNAGLVELMRKVGTFKIRQGSIGVGYAYNWVPARGLLVNVMMVPMVTLYNKQVLKRYDTEISESSVDDDLIHFMEEQTHWSRPAMTLNGRASITYNWDRYFFNVHGQWNSHNYNYGDGDGRINEWFVNTSLGYRF